MLNFLVVLKILGCSCLFCEASAIHYAGTSNQQTSICSFHTNPDSACYANAIKFISEEIEIRKGFIFLLGGKRLKRKYFDHGIYKFKVGKYLYKPNLNVSTFPCLHSTIVKERLENDEIALENLIPSNKNYKFVIFFSKKTGNYFECKIVLASNSEMDDHFSARTRFGKVLTLNFCTNEDQITDCKMTLARAG